MTRTRVPPVLVTGATGRVGRVVVDRPIDAGVPVRAPMHRSEAAATLPANRRSEAGNSGYKLVSMMDRAVSSLRRWWACQPILR